jgi:hypothetical protein
VFAAPAHPLLGVAQVFSSKKKVAVFSLLLLWFTPHGITEIFSDLRELGAANGRLA